MRCVRDSHTSHEPRTVWIRHQRAQRPSPPPSDTPTVATQLHAAPIDEPAVSPFLDGYEILEEIGRGGMGVVYKARQLGLDRVVAVKMLHASMLNDADLVSRLRSEAATLGSIQHPNITQIIEVAMTPAGPLLVMEYARGGTLAARLDGSPYSPGLAARLVLTLAQAVEAAHRQGFIHRDLKPGNVLVLEAGVPLDRATLKITDFGLARRLDDACGLTLSGQVIGTPGYMPPEQAKGPSSVVGPAADIYALGVLLYELLTGRLPYRGSTALETVHLMLLSEPLPPSRLRRELPRDLETITLKCLQKDPRRRYASAQALAEDLEAFLEGRPIQARPTGLPERVAKWARRQPGMAALTASIVAVALLSFVLVTWQWLRAEQAHAKSARATEHALELAAAEAEARREAQRLTARILLERGMALCESGDHGPGLLWLVRSLRAVPDGDDDMRQSLLLLLGGWSRLLYPFHFHQEHPDRVRGVAFSKDGRTFASAGGTAVVLQDADSGRELTRVDLQGQVLRLGSAADGVTAVVVRDGRAEVVSLPGGKPLGPAVPLAATPRCAAVSGDGQWLLLGLDDQTARLYRVATGQPEGDPWRHQGVVCAAAFSGDGKQALTGSGDNLAHLWDVPTGRRLRILTEHQRPVTAVAFSGDGAHLATAAGDARVCVWLSATGTVVHHLRGHERGVEALAFHPKQPLLASGSAEGATILWDVGSGQRVGAAIRHCSDVLALAFHPDGKLLATGSDDRTARAWVMRDPLPARAPGRLDKPIRCLASCPQGRLALTGTAQGGLYLWDLATMKSRQVDLHSTALAAAFAPDGKAFAVGYYDGTVRRYDAATLAQFGEPWPHGASVLALAYRPDGGAVAVGCDDADKRVRLRDARTGDVLREFVGHTRKVHGLAFSPDGSLLVTASWDRTARLWDVATGEPVGPVLKHQDLIQAVAFSPDGKRVLTGGDDYTARQWDVATGQLDGLPVRHPDKVTAVAYSADGRLFATGTKGGQARVWEAGTGKPMGPPKLHAWEVSAVAFTPGGQTLLTAGWDGLLRRWKVPTRQRNDVDRLQAWLEVQTGHRLNDPGIRVPLDLKGWKRRVEAMRQEPGEVR